MNAYLPNIQEAFGMFIFLGFELSALFLLISFGVELIQLYVPESKIQAILGGKSGRGYLFAAALGALTPFCSCSTIPMLRGLLKARAGFGPTMTFLFTSPLLNPLIVGLFWITFGLKVTIVYSLVALGVSIIGGVLLQRMGFERFVISYEVKSSNCCTPKPEPTVTTSCCATSVEEKPDAGFETQTACCLSTPEKQNRAVFFVQVKQAFRDSITQFRAVLPYLLIGIALGSFVYGFVPSEFIATYASGDSLLTVPIAAVIGIPLYVRVEALIPLSAVLVTKGMGLGAIMTLIIGGAGASLTEMILLKSIFRMPMIIAFVAVILSMAILAGYVFQFMM